MDGWLLLWRLAERDQAAGARRNGSFKSGANSKDSLHACHPHIAYYHIQFTQQATLLHRQSKSKARSSSCSRFRPPATSTLLIWHQPGRKGHEIDVPNFLCTYLQRGR
jgi:hypothetical protein